MKTSANSGITVPQERVDIINAVREISNRLSDVRDKVKNMKADVLGEDEQNKPSELHGNSLDDLVSGIFPTLVEIEDDLARVMNRLGVTTGLAKADLTSGKSYRELTKKGA